MRRFLLDTNHLGEAIGQISIVRDRIQRSHRSGNVFGTCGPALCELMVGIQFRNNAVRCRDRLKVLLQTVRLWPIELDVSAHYADIYRELRRAGRALSQVDIMLAAMARQYGATLLTTDQDFQAVLHIAKEDWITV